jgi:hypothetical protein
MHHLPSLRKSFKACDVLSAAAGEKTGCFFFAKKAQDVRRGEVEVVTPKTISCHNQKTDLCNPKLFPAATKI